MGGEETEGERMIYVTYQCKKCLDEFEVEVCLGESNDLPEACPACGARIPTDAHNQVEELAVAKAERWEDGP